MTAAELTQQRVDGPRSKPPLVVVPGPHPYRTAKRERHRTRFIVHASGATTDFTPQQPRSTSDPALHRFGDARRDSRPERRRGRRAAQTATEAVRSSERASYGDGWRRVAGALLGAGAGFAVYWAGAILVALPALAALPQQQWSGRLLHPLPDAVATEVLCMVTGALLGACVAKARWRPVALLSYLALLAVLSGYLIDALVVSIPQVPPETRWLSYLLLAAESGGLLLIIVFSFHSMDAAMRRHWARAPARRPYDARACPHVAVAIPVFNESFDMLRETVLHALQMDYPRHKLHVFVLDDSTDPAVRLRLAGFCNGVGATYVTRPNRAGFKAGALNHALRRMPREIDLVAVVDADYWVGRDFLRANVGHFCDARLGFLQTPQDYRNPDESFLTRQYKRAEAYFYHAIMPSRNEQNSIIFCGTMGIIRRRALRQAGGFAEDQICEDAELSVRLCAAGWDSLYVAQSFGRGIMPATFDAYKKQFHRWAFGNVRILFTRAGMILRSAMRPRQKLDFLVTNLHWFDGFFVLGISAVLLFLGIGVVVGDRTVTHHQRELPFIALIPAFLLVDGLLRLHMVLRRTGPVRMVDTILVQGMWMSIKFTNTVAALKCMMGRRLPFVRTPKHAGGRLGRRAALLQAIRLCKVETVLSLLLLGVAVADVLPWRVAGDHPPAPLLAVWLALYGVFFLCSPLYAYMSYRTLADHRTRQRSRAMTTRV